MDDRTLDFALENLSRLTDAAKRLSEQRLLELYDVASSLVELSLGYAADGLSTYDVLSCISSPLNATDTLADGTPDEIVEQLSRYVGVTGSLDNAVLAELYVLLGVERGLAIGEYNLLHVGGGEESFIYSRNAFSDEAYDVFSQDFSSARVRYGASFADCVRAVASGECRFCLLPLEERGGTRLPTVAELLYRSDLKINAVTPVFGFDGSADLKYALVSRDFTVVNACDGDDRYLEVRLSVDSATALDVFSAVSYFGHSIYRINTVCFDTEGERESYFSLVIRDGGGGFAPILVYLALFADDYTPVGLYKNLE